MLGHEAATKHSLALARWILGSFWVISLAIDPISNVALLPTDCYQPVGLFAWLPQRTWPYLLSETGLLLFKAALLAVLVIATTGIASGVILRGAAVVGVTAYQGLLRGYSGHMNHTELLSMYAFWVVVAAPSYDAWTIRRGTGAVRPVLSYASPFVCLTFIALLTYFFTGVARLWKSPQLLVSDSMFLLVFVEWAEAGAVGSSLVFALPSARPIQFDLPDVLWKPSFLVATAFEVAALLALLSHRFKVVWIAVAVVFHSMTAALLGVEFWPNIVVLGLTLGGPFHRLASSFERWRDSRSRPGGGGHWRLRAG